MPTTHSTPQIQAPLHHHPWFASRCSVQVCIPFNSPDPMDYPLTCSDSLRRGSRGARRFEEDWHCLREAANREVRRGERQGPHHRRRARPRGPPPHQVRPCRQTPTADPDLDPRPPVHLPERVGRPRTRDLQAEAAALTNTRRAGQRPVPTRCRRPGNCTVDKGA